MSESASAGASAPTGVTAASPSVTGTTAAPTTAPTTVEAPEARSTEAPEARPAGDKRSMIEALRSKRRSQEAATQAEEGPATDSAPVENAALEATEQVVDAKKEPETIPMEAFKKRLADEKRKRESLNQQVSDFELAVSKRDQAIELLKGEVRRLAEALQQGTGWDERDEQIRAYEFAEQVRGLQTELEAKHRQALAEAESRMRLEGTREQVKGFFAEALGKHGDLVSADELRAACKKQMGDNPDMPIDEIGRMVGQIADRIAEQRMDAFRRLSQTEKPAAPAMVRPAPNAKAGYEYSPNADGMRRWLAAKRQAK